MCNHHVGHAGLPTNRGGHVGEFNELCRIGSTITHCHYRRNNACSAARIYILLLQAPNTFPLPCIQKVLHSLVFALSLMVLNAFSPISLHSYNKYQVQAIPAVLHTTSPPSLESCGTSLCSAICNWQTSMANVCYITTDLVVGRLPGP
jgi:hypothetical protein